MSRRAIIKMGKIRRSRAFDDEKRMRKAISDVVNVFMEKFPEYQTLLLNQDMLEVRLVEEEREEESYESTWPL